jgi:hypothetical protein
MSGRVQLTVNILIATGLLQLTWFVEAGKKQKVSKPLEDISKGSYK